MNRIPVYLEVTIYVTENDDVQDVFENMFLEATYDGRDLETSITSYATAEQDTDTFLNTH
jgi:hypothetical protein